MINIQDKMYNELLKLRLDNGLYIASTGSFYRQFAWLRDCFYESLATLQDREKYEQTYATLLAWLKKVEIHYGKFSSMIENPQPKLHWRYLHARIEVATFDEVYGLWGNKQNDVIGEILYGIYLGEISGYNIIKDHTDIEIINKLIKYLEAIEYWQDCDSGIWEENEEVRASSIGACVAGLRGIADLGIGEINVPQWLIDVGFHYLNKLLPNETSTRRVDLAMLTLIAPFNVVTDEQARYIINRVTYELARDKGVIRYVGDQYFNHYGKEAEWTLGFCFLGLAHAKLGDMHMARMYYDRLIDGCEDGKIPELYLGGTNIKNENTPLGWSNSLTYVLGELTKNFQ